MDIQILDPSFNAVAYIDAYESIVWVDRYGEYGDFELYLPVTSDSVKFCVNGNYVVLDASDRTMIIRKMTIQSDAEKGAKLIVSGHSLEAILARRILWGVRTYSGSVQDAIQSMVNDSIISPSLSARKISNFAFDVSTDPAVTSLTMDETTYTGTNLYTAIKDICASFNLGFKVILDSANVLRFSLYMGKDCSYEQDVNPYVLFSPEYENLLSSEYIDSIESYRNVALVYGANKDYDTTAYRTEKRSNYSYSNDSLGDSVVRETETTTRYNRSGAVVGSTVVVTTTTKSPDEKNGWTDVLTSTTEKDASGAVISTINDHKETTKKTEVSGTYTNETDTNKQTTVTVKANGAKTTSTKTSTKHTGKDGNNVIWENVTDINDTLSATVNATTEESDKVSAVVGSETGLSRYEMFLDSSSISTNNDNGVAMPLATYTQKLATAGETELLDYQELNEYTGETDPTGMYAYGVDYNLGDIVQLSNEYGFTGTSRVTAITFTQAKDKLTVLPTFKAN